MKALCLLLLVWLSISGAAFAQNPTNKASLRVGEITIPTTGEYKSIPLSVGNLNFMRVDFSITPLSLGGSDEKGISIADSNGTYVLAFLDNNAPIQFAVYSGNQYVDQIYVQTPITINKAYDFTLFVGASSATLWWRKSAGMQKIGTLSHSLLPPLSMSVVAKRTGAKFSDIIVKEQ